ncbi:UNVERIFIED_CONTAM: putative membrane protein YesL [Acetivibrio alkalicellulosi]
MGSLFSFINYSKPGPGVPKNEPSKPRVIMFMILYIRKFGNLVKLNMLFSLFNIPALLLTTVLFLIFHGTFQSIFTGEMYFTLIMFFTFSAVFSSIPLITTGPAQAGFTYVLRNYSRQEYAFIFSDFKEHALKNFKQSMIISLIDFIVILIIFVNIYICTSEHINSFLALVSLYFIGLLSLFFYMMHLYIYPLLVTFNLSVKHIYKNAFIFSMVKFFPNVGILILCFALSAIPFLLFPVMAVILFPFITLSTIGFITNFYTYPILEKYMINKH